MTIAEFKAKNKKKTIAGFKASQKKLASTPFAKRESMGLSAAIDRDSSQAANDALRQRMIEREAERLAKIETEKIAQAAVIAKQKLSQEDEMRKAALPTGIRFEPERVTSDRIPKISDINRSAANVDYSREIQDVESRFPKTPLTFAEKAQKYNPLAIADMMINKAGAGVVQSGAAIADSVAASVKAREDSAFTQYIDNARNVFQSMQNKAYPSSQANAPQNWDVDKKVEYYRGNTLQDRADRYSADIDKRYIGLTDTFITKGLSDLAQSTGYMIPSAVTNAILPGSGTALLFAAGYAQGERQAIQAGSTPEDARRYALLNGLNQSAGELMIGGVLGKGAGLLDSAFRKAGLDIVSSIKNPVLRRAVGAAMRIGGESAEEAVQNVLDTLAQKATYNTDAKFDPKAIAYDALLGGAMSALFGLAGNVKTLALPSVKEAVLPSIAPVTTSRASIDSEDYFKQKTSAINGKVNELSGRLRTQDEEVLYNRLVAAKSDTEKSGILAGASDTDIKLISETAKKLGKDILFYSEGKTESGNIRNGYEFGGRLYINAKAAVSSQWVAAHELTHSIENTATYAKLNKYLMGRMTADELKVKRSEMSRIRTSEGANLTAEEIDQEIVADYVANNLLRNESDILNLVKTDMTLGEKIRDWIDTVIKKVTGTDAEAFYVTAKGMYTKALAEAKRVSGMREATAKASVSETDSEGNPLSEDVIERNKTSKIRNADGKLIPMYHATNADFTVFDKGKIGSSGAGRYLGYGFNFAASEGTAEQYGKNVMKTYLNVANPMTDTEKTISPVKLSSLIEKVDSANPDFTDDISQSLAWDYSSNGYTINPNDSESMQQMKYKRAVREAAKSIYDSAESDADIYSAISVGQSTAEAVMDTFSKFGKDGVIWHNDDGNIRYAVTFESNQAKKTDNTKPTDNPDIRYSISDTAYMDAVERGDTDTAQKMVDEAAKKAGYNVKAYHGSKNTFTVFSEALRGTNQTTEAGKKYFFAGDRETAESYSPYHVLKNLAETMPKMFRMKDADATKGKGGVMNLYISMNNPLEEDLIDYDWSAHAEKSDALVEYIEQAETNGNDGLIFHHVPDNLMKPGKRISTIYLFKNPSQAKSADPVTYDDSGNVIPLSKRFDSEKTDIRYSISEDEAAAPRTTAELESENKKLRELNEYQRKQMKRTTVIEPNIHAVYSYVKRLKKSYDSVTPVKQIADKLSALYVYAANGEGEEHGHDWHYMYEYARDIAKDILSGSKRVIEPETLERYNQLKKHVKGIKFYVSPKDKGDFGDFNAFRVKNMSKFGITTADGEGAVGINNTYSQLTDAFGEDWFPSEIWNQADQLQQLSDMLGGLDKLYKYPYSNKQFEEVAAFVAGDILDAFYDIPQAPPTFADKAEKKLVLEKVKAAHKVERLREEKNSRIENLRVSMREQSMKKINALRENNEKKIAALKEATQKRIAKSAQGRNATDIRRKLKHNCAEMAKKLTNPDKNSHVPDSLRQTVAELLQMIEFSPDEVIQSGDNKGQKKSDVLKAKLRRVSETYRRFIATTDEVKPIADVDMQNMFDEAQDSLSVKSIRQLDAEELANLYKLTKSIYSAIRKENKSFIKGKQDSIDGTAEDVRAENKEKGSRNDPTKWLPKVADKLLNFATMDPRAFFKRLGATMESLYMNIEQGQDKYIETVTRTVNFMGDTLKGVDTTKWDGPDAEIITVGVYGDYLKKEIHEVKMTPAMIMELYLLNQREQARKHIYGQAGISLMMPGASKTQPPVIVTEDDVNGIIAKMTPEMKRVADAMGKYVSEDMSVLGNEVSLAMYGYSKFTDPHYWQIHVDKGGVPATYGETQGDPKLANNGFTKALKEVASNPLVIGSALDTFDKHTVQMAAYNAYVLPLSDMERVLNNKDMFGMTVGSMISDKHGAEARKYIDSFMKLVNGAKLSNNLWNDDISSKLLRNFKSAAVGLNLSVLAKQPISYIRAANEVNPKYLTEALKIESRASRKKNMNEMLKYNPIARIKDWGYADMGFGKNQRQLYDKSAMTVSDKVSEVSGYLPSMADKVTWARIWSAVKSEQNAKGIFDLREIAVRFKEVISNTQVVNTIFTTPAILNSDSLLTKMSTAFMGEPLKTYNMLKTALESKNSAKIVRASGVLLANTFAVAVVTTVFSNLRDKDDDDDDMFDIGKEVLQNMAYDTAGMIPYFRDLSSLFQGYDIQRTDLAGVGKIFDALRSLKGDIELAANGNAPKGTALLHTKNMVAALSQVLGVPVGNVWRDFESIMMSAAEASGNAAMEYLMTVSMYNPENAQNRKYYYDMLDKYRDDKDVFEKLSKLLKGKYGYTDDQIQNGMRERMKDTEEYKDAFKTVSNDTVPGIESSEYYLKLPKAERDEVMKQAKTYAGGVAMAQADKTYKQSAWAQNITDAVASGLTAGEYLLFAAAKRKADAAGNDNGSYSTEEQIAALRDMDWLPVSKQELLYKGMADNADELAARTDKLEALTDAGLNFAEFLNIYQKHGEIGADDTLKASQQALKFANWLDERYTLEQSDIAQEHFGYWSGAKANPSNYNKFADAGIEYDTAYEIAADLMALSPLEGKKSVSNAQQYRLIADSDYDDKIKIQAMSVLMEESAYTNFRKATLKGVSIKKYVDFVENSARIESDIEDGKPVLDSKKQKVLTLIDKMVLTIKGKDALYYAAGYKESTIDEAPWYSGERYDGDIYQRKSNGIVIRKLPKKS